MKKRKREESSYEEKCTKKQKSYSTYTSTSEEESNSSSKQHYSFLGMPLYRETESTEEDYEHSGLPTNEHGYTSLHNAAEEGNVKLCEEIIKKHPLAVNDVINFGYLPLDLAVLNKHVKICQILMAHMSNKEIFELRREGGSLLELIVTQDVITEEDKEIFEMLLARIPENNSPPIYVPVFYDALLRIAASKGHKTMCELLIQKDHNAVRAVDASGDNALHSAAKNLKMEIVKLLVNNMSLRDICNSLPLKEISSKLLYEDEITFPNSGLVVLNSICTMVSRYICEQIPQVGYPKLEDNSFTHHFKLFKLYAIISRNNLFKFHLDRIIDFLGIQNHEELCKNADEYIAENYFMLRGICKTPANTFSETLGDCTKNILYHAAQQFYLEPPLCVPVEQLGEAGAICAGQDSNLANLPNN